MGVPKFYRWISERYPALSEVINDSQIPEFDNLYLDMNGIIHNCSHPNDDDVMFRITEEQIFQDIFDYIEKLFLIIRPRKVFYLAIDGVAPRAKMNQQRARRFMSARTAQEQLDKAIKKGEEIPDEKRFDSNCITPGTPFMVRLHSQLSQWIARKINMDSKWQGIRIILSGHNVPGEGEHKIMDFIRAERIQEGYDVNTRHCMYGLDADLMMLGICSHEPHFSLLREEVKFGRPPRPNKKDGKKEVKKPVAKPSETTFHLLHLSLLREYLAWEFYSIKDLLSFPYDQERIIDDWVLMGFLVGNDFIPHLPHVHIHDDGLPFLFDAYKKVLPTLDGYINESGYLNLKRFEKFLKAVAENDRDHYLKMVEDESFIQGKRGRQKDLHGRAVQPGMFDALLEQEAADGKEDLVPFEDSDMSDATDDGNDGGSGWTTTEDEAAFVSSDEGEPDVTQRLNSKEDCGGIASAADALAGLDLQDDDAVDAEFTQQLAMAELSHMDDKEFESNVAACWSRSVGNGFKRHKRTYYKEKLKFSNISKDQLKEQSEGYVRAIQWILHYYYHGCVSWSWYFEHHYAPYISDVADFSSMEMNFELSEPFLPFEQLLSVLPAASADCLPPAMRELMTDPESPIADFYPTNFKTDLNGKKNDWEAVVLIPFIEEKKLLEAIRSKEAQMTQEEINRNKHGNHCLFTTEYSEGTTKPKANLKFLDKDLFRIPKEKVVWGLLPAVKLDVFFPGFPTMKHLPHTGKLKMVNVSVFQQPSRKPSMVLTIGNREDQAPDMSTLATDLIDSEVCVEWPVLKMGVVDHVCSLTHRYQALNGALSVEELSEEEMKLTAKKLQMIKDRQISRFAIDCGNPKAIAYVKRFLGVTYEVKEGMLVPRKQYGGVEDAMAVPVNLVVSNIIVEEGKRLQEIPIEKAYPPQSRVFVMSPAVQAFGYPCLVDNVENVGAENCRIRVVCAILSHPDFSKIKSNMQAHCLPWFDGYQMSKRVGISNRLIGRITGTVFLIDGEREKEERGSGFGVKINIGLNLKLTKRNLEVPDYTRRTKENFWQYSSLTTHLLNDYRTRFPEIFHCLENSTSYDDVYYGDDIWEDKTIRETRICELKEYLADLPTASVEKQEAGALTADCMLMASVENAVRAVRTGAQMFKGAVTPNIIYKPDLYDGKVRFDPEADFQLLDRVVSIVYGAAPFGQLGTVIAVSSDKLEVLFDKEFQGGRELNSVARVPIASVINITFAKERKGKAKVESTTTPDTSATFEPKPETSKNYTRFGAGRDINAPNYSQKVQARKEPKEKHAKRKAEQEQKKEHPPALKLLLRAKEKPGTNAKAEQNAKLRVKSQSPEFELKAQTSKADVRLPAPKSEKSQAPKLILKREDNPEDERKKVEDHISIMLGLSGKKTTQQSQQNTNKTTSKKSPADEKDIVEPVMMLLKREETKEAAENRPPSRKEKKDPATTSTSREENKKWGPPKKANYHKDRVVVNSAAAQPKQAPQPQLPSQAMMPLATVRPPFIPLQPQFITVVPPVMVIQQLLAHQPQQQAPNMIPISNVDPMKLTDLKPSTVSTFKRGGGKGGSHRGAPSGRKPNNARGATSSPLIENSVNVSSNPSATERKSPGPSSKNNNGKKKRKSRLAATFPAS